MADPQEPAKAAAARRAIEGLKPGRVALGTGSTAAFVVRAIAEAHPAGRGFEFVASSKATESLATSLGLPVRAVRGRDRCSVMFDGADEVSPNLDLTKGGGGALLREKFLAELSERLVIVVDPTKLVPGLGARSPIPVEVVPFTAAVVAERIERLGYRAEPRRGEGGAPFLTDNGNEILDVRPRSPLADPRATHITLRSITGVVETGIFPGLADQVIIGQPDGRTEERNAPAGRRRT